MAIALDLNGPSTGAFERWPDQTVESGITRRFDTVVAQHADRLALDDGRHRLTYARLAAAARQLAARIATDCPPGPVGILQPHSAAFWVAILACCGAGRTYVALDLHHPATRNAAILQDAGLAAVIVPPGFAAAAEVIPHDMPRLAWRWRNPSATPRIGRVPRRPRRMPRRWCFTPPAAPAGRRASPTTSRPCCNGSRNT